MGKNINIYYDKNIRPLPLNDKLYIARKILDDASGNNDALLTPDKSRIKNLLRFKALFKDTTYNASEEDWYLQ